MSTRRDAVDRRTRPAPSAAARRRSGRTPRPAARRRRGCRRPGRAIGSPAALDGRAASRARSPSSAARRSVISALRLVGDRARAEPATRARSWTCASAAGSMPRTVTGGGSAVPASTRSARGRCGARGPAPRRRRPASPAMASTVSRRQAGLAERRDPQVGPADEVADGPVDRRLDAGVASRAPRTGPRRRGRRRAMVSAVRSGRAREAAPGEPVERTSWPTATGRAGRAGR